ncbi:MAG: hypothetical protein PVJ43_13645 [Gemmatimonadales bacterium]|jgi:hypothetical protein
MQRGILGRAAATTLPIAVLFIGPASSGLAQVGGGTEPVPTRVMVRVIGHDSKVIGSGVGGVLVRVVDSRTGDLLAEGKQEGGTGDTDRIMSRQPRGTGVFDTGSTAGFLAELRLSEPTLVNISALGPLGYPQAIHSATKQLLLVPGRHIEGDGIVLELHGFIVEILSPEPLTPVGSAVQVTARVRMMCGCPIEPGGLWDADGKEFVARLWADGRVVSEASLEFAGETSMFEGSVGVPGVAQGADLELEVVVSEAARQNFGRHAIPLGLVEGEGSR